MSRIFGAFPLSTVSLLCSTTIHMSFFAHLHRFSLFPSPKVCPPLLQTLPPFPPPSLPSFPPPPLPPKHHPIIKIPPPPPSLPPPLEPQRRRAKRRHVPRPRLSAPPRPSRPPSPKATRQIIKRMREGGVVGMVGGGREVAKGEPPVIGVIGPAGGEGMRTREEEAAVDSACAFRGPMHRRRGGAAATAAAAAASGAARGSGGGCQGGSSSRVVSLKEGFPGPFLLG